MTSIEHPFATYIRILGKGQRGARDLTQDEAFEAMSLILEQRIEPVQLGAFLMLLRRKEETPEELAGFTRAIRTQLQNIPPIQVDLDWPTYAGKKRRLPWFLLAVKALAHSGIRILLHGAGAHTPDRLYTEQLLETLSIPLCHDWMQVDAALAQHRLAFIPLADWMPALQTLIDLRPLLGLRSPIHTLVRMINPLQATCVLQSIFHPGYQPMHRDASRLLHDRSIVIKGEGGEIEINPEKDCTLMGTENGDIWQETWPAMTQQRRARGEMAVGQLLDMWHGVYQDEYALEAILATMALALRGLGSDRDTAWTQAQHLWQQRLDA